MAGHPGNKQATWAGGRSDGLSRDFVPPDNIRFSQRLMDDPNTTGKRREKRGVARGEFHLLPVISQERGASGDEVTEFCVHDGAPELAGSRFPRAGLDSTVGRYKAVAL